MAALRTFIGFNVKNRNKTNRTKTPSCTNNTGCAPKCLSKREQNTDLIATNVHRVHKRAITFSVRFNHDGNKHSVSIRLHQISPHHNNNNYYTHSHSQTVCIALYLARSHTPHIRIRNIRSIPSHYQSLLFANCQMLLNE